MNFLMNDVTIVLLTLTTMVLIFSVYLNAKIWVKNSKKQRKGKWKFAFSSFITSLMTFGIVIINLTLIYFVLHYALEIEILVKL